MMCRERATVYCRDDTKYTNTWCGQNAEKFVLNMVVRTVTNRLSRIKNYEVKDCDFVLRLL